MNKASPLQPGERAPDFHALDENGQAVSSKSFSCKRYLVYFYPRDLTPGCATQACAFRDQYDEFTKLGVPVIGVSTDGQASHRRFIQKHNLPFPLLVDEEGLIAKAFGVWGQKKFMGKEYEGIHRTSFLVGTDGKIERTYSKIKPGEHAAVALVDLGR